MLIREIREKDNISIAEIIRTAMKEFDADPRTTILGDPTLDHMFETYQIPGAVYYVIEEDGQLTGGCGIRHLDNSDENICELQRMFILSSSRGKGYGKILIDMSLKKAREFGYEKIYLETLSQMKRAISIYEQTGFRKIKSPLGNTGHSGCNIYMEMKL